MYGASSNSNSYSPDVQAMAAAMLPLIWPSFQLTATTALSNQQSIPNRRETQPDAPIWPMEYKQLTRAKNVTFTPSAESSWIPTVADAPSRPTPTTSTTTRAPVAVGVIVDGRAVQRSPRKRRRKPNYLETPLNGNPAPTSAYPDSTKLASRYQMPRMKYLARNTTPPFAKNSSRVSSTVAPSLGPAITASAAFLGFGVTPVASTTSRLAGEPHKELPKSLSKLIEEQLLKNATTLLQYHKNQLASTTTSATLPPTTSVSKLVRFKNDTQILVSASDGVDLRRKFEFGTTRIPAVAPVRMLATTTATPVTSTTTTSAPPATTRRSTTTTTTTSTTTSTTTQPPKIVTIDVDDSNESDEQPSSSTTTTEQPPKRAKSKFKAQIALPKSKPNIKLFDLRRKPDMDKLPFYKKPLNFDQIEAGPAGKVMQSEAATNASQSPGGDSEQNNALGSDTTSAIQLEEKRELLLKRKRRGKNQFDKLMAELHGSSSTTSTTLSPPTISTPSKLTSAGGGRDEADQPDDDDDDGDRPTTAPVSRLEPQHHLPSVVPAFKNKSEPFVMKPVFLFSVNQKRRNQAATANQPTPADSTGPAPQPQPPPDSSLLLDELPARNRSKPIIRLRRKHHGEQPAAIRFPDSAAWNSQWRPSRPLWVPKRIESSSEQQLVLVPSGVLTPSGSHLIPLYASSQNEQPNWRPAPARLNQPLVSPKLDPVTGAMNATATSGQPTMASNNGTELRVPKLLSKPARPAKYSLNGYIPKPSLNQQQHQADQSQHEQQQPTISGQQILAGNRKPRVRLLSAGHHSDQHQHHSTNKDLDSSTSNEIFSRRRGLQQQQLQLQQQHQRNQSNNNNQTLINQRQMEAKRRKYVEQQQNSLKTPTLSAQKVNMIKAQLGLSVSNLAASSSSSSSSSSQRRNTRSSDRTAPATNSLPTTDDSDSLTKANDLASQIGGQPLIGAPLHSIPKTDFECADSRGKFVAGLFADQQTNCQVWHLCFNNRKYSFLCPSGLIFNEKSRICDWRYNVKCESALSSPPAKSARSSNPGDAAAAAA